MVKYTTGMRFAGAWLPRVGECEFFYYATEARDRWLYRALTAWMEENCV